MVRNLRAHAVPMACFVLLGGLPVFADQLITNGGFETGDLAGWSEFDQAGGTGSWFVTGATTTPVSGSGTVGPASGSFYAVTDQSGPGSHALIQRFTVPVSATTLLILLSYSMFLNDQDGGPFCTGLDFTVSQTQCGRVDILTASATPFDTGAGVFVTLQQGADPIAKNPNPYTNYGMFDLTGILTPGTTYQLRFAEADNQSFFNLGVDNVSLLAREAVPEPATIFLLGTGLAAVLAIKRRPIRKV